MIEFTRGEGIWFDSGLVYLATTTRQTIHVYDTHEYDRRPLRAADAPGTPLRDVDNVTVRAPATCSSPRILRTTPMRRRLPDHPEREVSRFLKMTGSDHPGSETVGITFEPGGTRMYVGSQRYRRRGSCTRSPARSAGPRARRRRRRPRRRRPPR